jgi:hypothetical protein
MQNLEVATAHSAETEGAGWWHVTELSLEHLRGWMAGKTYSQRWREICGKDMFITAICEGTYPH